MPEWIDSLAPTLSLGELFVRGTITFLGLTFLLRIVGQREAGGLGMADLLVVLLAVDAAGMEIDPRGHRPPRRDADAGAHRGPDRAGPAPG